MRKIKFIIFVTVISTLLAGCADSDYEDTKNVQTMIELNAVQSIAVQNDSGASMDITDRKSIERFDEVIHHAVYDIGQLDIASPDYVASVKAENGGAVTFSFWMEGENDALFIKSGQNGHYKLRGTAKATLLDLFQSDEPLNRLAFIAERKADGELVAKPIIPAGLGALS
ncbi:hypothetical protein M6D81_24720 [Paenibacillus sp. J5C_2022]|uniref:hypothetical protein n=1 Tax=Paenibacillus sp. J5C2022 TaxID=2977129 RepID=UPI0021D14177|nr:hypothetical protein [Paenibacillus sp. J5C2022]MCU6711910.1 hypothetical protein [Paenibacillus sp. J5C2022]